MGWKADRPRASPQGDRGQSLKLNPSFYFKEAELRFVETSTPQYGSGCGPSLHVANLILRHHIAALRGTGRGLLVRVGEGTRKIVTELEKKGVQATTFSDPALRDWIEFSSDQPVDTDTLSATVETVLNGLAQFEEGLLVLREEYEEVSSWGAAPLVIGTGASYYEIDHFAVVLADRREHAKWLERLEETGSRPIEGPGVWPDDFCEHLASSNAQLSMVFATAELPHGGAVVLLAPNTPGDQLDCWRRGRQHGALHHVAVRVSNIETAAREFCDDGWKPMSKQPVSDGDLTQWFLKNAADQIVELISRRDESSSATFSCANISQLRSAELRHLKRPTKDQ